MRREFALGACVFFAGCFPLRGKARVAQTIVIVDAESATPITGARVVVETFQDVRPSGRIGRKLGVYAALTDNQGMVRIPALMNWDLVMIGLEPGSYNSRICIEKAGYDLFEFDPWGKNGGYPSNEFKGTYSLKPSRGSRKAACFEK